MENGCFNIKYFKKIDHFWNDQDLNRAKAVLLDPHRRRIYDQTGHDDNSTSGYYSEEIEATVVYRRRFLISEGGDKDQWKSGRSAH